MVMDWGVNELNVNNLDLAWLETSYAKLELCSSSSQTDGKPAQAQFTKL